MKDMHVSFLSHQISPVCNLHILCLFFLLSFHMVNSTNFRPGATNRFAFTGKGNNLPKSATSADQQLSRLLLDSNMIVDFSGAWGSCLLFHFPLFRQ